MDAKPVTVSYWREKDILLVKLAARPAKVDVNRFDFMTRYDEETDAIVGFEIMDFGERFIPHLYEPDAIPAEALELRFEVPEGGLHGVDLRDVLEWAYSRYCACHLPVHQPPVEAMAAA